VHVRVALDRKGQVRSERRPRGLIGEQVLLVRQRQPRQLVEVGQARISDALALEGVRLRYEAQQGVQALEPIHRLTALGRASKKSDMTWRAARDTSQQALRSTDRRRER
jgi:hypothetical protein